MTYVYFFKQGQADGKTEMKEILGGKGANLAEMGNLGIPIPPGFTISTEVCDYYYKNDQKYPNELDSEVKENLRKLEDVTGKKFGDPAGPLLVSVRSGAAISMPGMMDTVLNVGLNRETVDGISEKTGNPRFTWDSYRRLIQMFGNVVKGIKHDKFDSGIENKKKEKGVKHDTELDTEDLQDIVKKFKEIYREELGQEFPQEPFDQLWQAIDAVFGSWNIPRAVKYREINDINGLLGTAVNVQTMVFGNMGQDSASGVAFTRNPATGEKKYYGEYLRNSQGEDVVAGIRTPRDIKEIEEDMPEIYRELEDVFVKLERHYKDVQDVEFTIQEGKLYMLQTRTGKRTAKAAVKIAVDMVEESLITKEEAIQRIEPEQLDQLLHPSFDPEAEREVIASGLNASPGAATGKVVFTSDQAERLAEDGEKLILVRTETSPDDIHGLEAAKGVLTSRGGMTSHAAIVARGMGKPAVVGTEKINIDYSDKLFTINEKVVKQGDWISIDGTTGEVMLGQIPMVEPKMDENFQKILGWADQVRKLGVRTNADTPKDAQVALDLGCEGIGLARTEHMFFQEERLPLMQGVIIAKDKEEREKYLTKLAQFQKDDFKELLQVMKGKPVIIRLLDPPLHEFLPDDEEEIDRLAEKLEVDKHKLSETVKSLEEFNPMLGYRGCRVGITTPEIYNMQAEAILRAAYELKKEDVDAKPRIMIPLIGHINEMKLIKNEIEKLTEDILKETETDLNYKIGTMIEIPRACVTADEIATEAEFFSFGTNDLTQMTFGFSRDDAVKFLPTYDKKLILERNPFQTIDQNGVGELMKIAVKKGRKARPDLSVGICGEQGGDPRSIEFCHLLGLDYVSASPYRVPIARLAAAQTALNNHFNR